MTAVLILADIEGSSGCQCADDARLFKEGWAKACVELSHDLAEISNQLFSHGVERVRIKDFHRTGYNIFAELLPGRVELDQGYRSGPVAGIGDVTGFDYLMLTGMHAASGSEGFLPHTLTSRFAAIRVNGKLLSEAELFASSVAPYGLAPIFFSGCPVACDQAKQAIPGIQTFAVNKPVTEAAQQLRQRMAEAAVQSLLTAVQQPRDSMVFRPAGPFSVKITMRDGVTAAKKLQESWQLAGSEDWLSFSAATMDAVYWELIKLAYLTPMTYRFINPSLGLANLWGRITRQWARYRAHCR